MDHVTSLDLDQAASRMMKPDPRGQASRIGDRDESIAAAMNHEHGR
jgi:hypothetical protein